MHASAFLRMSSTSVVLGTGRMRRKQCTSWLVKGGFPGQNPQVITGDVAKPEWDGPSPQQKGSN